MQRAALWISCQAEVVPRSFAAQPELVSPELKAVPPRHHKCTGRLAMSSEDKKHRSHLPMPAPERTGLITYDARDRDTKFPPIEQLQPAQQRPIEGVSMGSPRLA